MDALYSVIDFVLHVDTHLDHLIQEYGTWTYAILGLIVFMETGLVVTPILPGDSLLFAAGMFAARGALDQKLVFVVLTCAALLGDNTNYWIGRYLGPKVLKNENSRIFRKSYLDKTHAFFERYGAMTIVLARFVPIVRTFAPFVAGVGQMTYTTYLAFSVFGAVAWVGICTFAGYFLGNIPVVRDNFEVAVLLIVAVSLLPPVIEWARHRFGRSEVAR
ncbi:MAG: DedA family protein [Myxococcota bacterium]